MGNLTIIAVAAAVGIGGAYALSNRQVQAPPAPSVPPITPPAPQPPPVMSPPPLPFYTVTGGGTAYGPYFPQVQDYVYSITMTGNGYPVVLSSVSGWAAPGNLGVHYNGISYTAGAQGLVGFGLVDAVRSNLGNVTDFSGSVAMPVGFYNQPSPYHSQTEINNAIAYNQKQLSDFLASYPNGQFYRFANNNSYGEVWTSQLPAIWRNAIAMLQNTTADAE